MTTVGTSNVNFGRGWRAHKRDIAAALKKVDVLAVQELRRPLRSALRRLARTFQPKRNRREAGSEGLFVAKRSGVKVLRRGSKRASWRTFGQAIGPRRLPWLLCDFPDVGAPVLVICYHRVPLRMQRSQIDEAQDARVRGLIEWAEENGWHWIVAGDLNQLERADPAGLARRYRGTWHGKRIDLICVSPGLRVVRQWHKQDPKRNDKHPLVCVDVRER